jgi:hypothetical protein
MYVPVNVRVFFAIYGAMRSLTQQLAFVGGRSVLSWNEMEWNGRGCACVTVAVEVRVWSIRTCDIFICRSGFLAVLHLTTPKLYSYIPSMADETRLLSRAKSVV